MPKHGLTDQVIKGGKKNKIHKEEEHMKESVADSLRKNNHVKHESQIPSFYYIENALKSLVDPALQPIREHIVQSIQTLNYLQNVRKPSSKELEPHSVRLPETHRTLLYNLDEFSIILDLDETLIHCNESVHVQNDVTLTIKFPTGEKIEAGVNVRPFAVDFIK